MVVVVAIVAARHSLPPPCAMLLLSLVLGAASTPQLPRSRTWAECTASGGVPGANYPGGE